MKKGFTLVELLIVIVIIGFISLIAYPAVIKIINDSKQSTYESQVKIVEKAAKEWGVENPTKLPNDSSTTKTLTLNTLINDGYISDDNIKNPKTKSNMCGVIEITYNQDNNQYEYKYNGNTCGE